jgi:hypothetical protein
MARFYETVIRDRGFQEFMKMDSEYSTVLVIVYAFILVYFESKTSNHLIKLFVFRFFLIGYKDARLFRFYIG